MFPFSTHLLPGGDLEFRPGLPNNFNGSQLAHATQVHAKTNIADITTQLFETRLFMIRLTNAKFLKNILATTQTNRGGLYVQFQLKNSQRLSINDREQFHIREEQYAGVLSNGLNCQYKFQPNKEYHSLELYYSTELLLEFKDAFPGLEQYILKAPSNRLSFGSCWISFPMRQEINEILNIPVNSHVVPLWYEQKARQLLTMILHQRFYGDNEKISLTPFERNRILKAKKILQSFISRKAPDARLVAGMVDLSENKLRLGFQQEFKMSMYEWLMEEKMKIALDLLLNTGEPVKSIGLQVGFPRQCNFTAAFQRRFDMTPGSCRR